MSEYVADTKVQQPADERKLKHGKFGNGGELRNVNGSRSAGSSRSSTLCT